MIRGSLSRRYARAMLSIGVASEQREAVGQQLSQLADLVVAFPDLRLTLENPSYAHARRLAIVRRLGERLELIRPVNNLLLLLVDRNRITLLAEIARQYEALADEHAGRIRAEVTTARKIDAEGMRQLRRALEQKTGKQVVLTARTDPDLLAGTVAKIGSVIYDGSLRMQLQNMRETLLESRY